MTARLVDVRRLTDVGYVRHAYPAHCHPTEALRAGKDWDCWIEELEKVDLRKICVMSTDSYDQARVADLAHLQNPKIVPCFGRSCSDTGFHPWSSHTLSLDECPEKIAHYTKLFGEPNDESKSLYEAFPQPKSLKSALAELEAYLVHFPDALVGEVGLDRSYRIPDPRQTERGLTRLQTPLAHQLVVLRAQVELACRLKRSVSMHSVRATGQTSDFLDEMQASPAFAGICTSLH